MPVLVLPKRSPAGSETGIVAGVIGVRQFIGSGNEAVSCTVGPDGAASGHGFGEVNIDRGPRDGLESLELTGRGNVEFLKQNRGG